MHETRETPVDVSFFPLSPPFSSPWITFWRRATNLLLVQEEPRSAGVLSLGHSWRVQACPKQWQLQEDESSMKPQLVEAHATQLPQCVGKQIAFSAQNIYTYSHHTHIK